MMRGRNEQAWVHHRALAGTQDPALRLLSHCNSFWGAEKAAPRLVVNNGNRIQKISETLNVGAQSYCCLYKGAWRSA